MKLLLLASALLLGGCAASAPREEQMLGKMQFEPGVEFQLAVGKSADSQNRYSVTFSRVIEDSRCPMNARCIWEGNAKIEVNLAEFRQEPGRKIAPAFVERLELDTSERFTRHREVRGLIVSLVHLEPTPMTGETVKDYVATLRVEAQP
jgi:hypothetical protein